MKIWNKIGLLRFHLSIKKNEMFVYVVKTNGFSNKKYINFTIIQ